jgi:hypothetical protein
LSFRGIHTDQEEALSMSPAAIVGIVVAVVVIAVIVILLVVRARRRRAGASHRLGLPELGALSTDGLDKVHAHGTNTQGTTSSHN